MHHEIGPAWYLRPRLPRRLGIAVAELGPHILAADEGRVAPSRTPPRPGRPARVEVFEDRHRRRRIGHILAGDQVRLAGEAVPAGARAAGLFEHRPGASWARTASWWDRAVGVEDRLVQIDARPDLPL
jgi:hypothetical protein